MCSHFLTLCGNLYTFTALGLDLVGQHRGTCGAGIPEGLAAAGPRVIGGRPRGFAARTFYGPGQNSQKNALAALVRGARMQFTLLAYRASSSTCPMYKLITNGLPKY